MWMISEIHKTSVPIHFNAEALANFVGLYDEAADPTLLPRHPGGVNEATDASLKTPILGTFPTERGTSSSPRPYYANANIVPSVGDALAVQKWGDLITVPLWWILECFPFKRKYQDLSDPKKRWRVSFWWVMPGSFVSYERLAQELA